MVLGHQSVLANMSGGPPGLQPALQLAAVAAHLAPRSRVPWAPFLQFGMTNPMLFGAPFLTRPHFNGHSAHNLINSQTNSQSPGIISNRSAQSQQSEDSNDERGEFFIYKFLPTAKSGSCLHILMQYAHVCVDLSINLTATLTVGA